MRALAALATAGLLITSSPALGRTTPMNPYTEDELRQKCTNNGGTYGRAPDGSSYWCSKKCKGGTCTVLCTPGQPCDGNTPGRVSAPNDPKLFDKVLANTLAEDKGNDLPEWLGLLGLLGLAGLLGRRRDPTHTPR